MMKQGFHPDSGACLKIATQYTLVLSASLHPTDWPPLPASSLLCWCLRLQSGVRMLVSLTAVSGAIGEGTDRQMDSVSIEQSSLRVLASREPGVTTGLEPFPYLFPLQSRP